MNDDAERYLEFSKKWDPNDPKHTVLTYINVGESVLDVGCSYGSFGKRLIEMGCECDGVEFYQPAIDLAKTILQTVYQIDLNDAQGLGRITKLYDAITFLDVLEHCIDPDKVLSTLNKNLKPSGKVYVSLPNIANFIDRWQILRGRFDYQEYGVMDKTHLRFFTKKTAIQLVGNHFKSVRCVAYTPRHPVLKPVVKLWPTLLAMQFIIEGRLIE
jgi:2-polyprenyl-3-methyl-5-hydroxy-6-metoxy-1,4-benzoquinol methylase